MSISVDNDSETVAFIKGHLELHNYNPVGVAKDKLITPRLKENLEEIDYEYVKGLQGLQNIDKITKLMKFCSQYDIPKLRQVYVCLIATEFSMSGRQSQAMNEHLSTNPPEKYRLAAKHRNMIDISVERIKEMETKYSFINTKEKKQE